MKTILINFLLLSIVILAAAQPGADILDLKSRWQININDQFVSYQNESTKAIYFWITPKTDKRHFLVVDGRKRYSVFVNNKLIVQKAGKTRLSVDSLTDLYPNKLFVGVYSENGVHHIITKLQSDLKIDKPLTLRKGNYFLDFSVLATLMLIICAVLFWRTNPALTIDYLNVNKLFSLQDKDDSTLTLRIASSVNLLIYLFGSFFTGLMLIIAFHFIGDQFWLSQQFSITSTAQAFWHWVVLSLIIYAGLMFKLIWLVLLTSLFAFRDTASFQFFNFMRTILLSVITLAIICVLYFVFGVRDENYFYFLISILSTIFIAGTTVVYFKLMSRMPFHFFHLFSYLCVSEIIPLMVLIKVFFY